MKNRFVLLVGGLVLFCLAAYMCCYTVDYNQTALLKTFNKADASDVKSEPGLKFKWPAPFQTVEFFSSSLHVLDTPLQNQKLKDDNLLVLKCYVNWKIIDPLKFSIQLNDASNANRLLGTHITNAVSDTVGSHVLNDFFGDKGQQEKIEQEALVLIQKIVKDQGYGIEISHLGFRRIELNGNVTIKVFEAMKQKSTTTAEAVKAAGKSTAKGIETDADNAAERILAFAKRRSESIRSKGRDEAAKLLVQFATNQEFAVILEKMETLERALDSTAPGVRIVLPISEIIGSRNVKTKAKN